MLAAPTTCPCNPQHQFEACCRPIIEGAPAPTAEALMRSRYSAFATGNVAHLVRTRARDTDAAEQAEIAAWCQATDWIGLTIRSTERGGPSDLEGWVEFSARFFEDHELWVLQERSNFQRRDGRWVYIDGQAHRFRDSKPRRNDPCPCGSGTKYKACHGT